MTNSATRNKDQLSKDYGDEAPTWKEFTIVFVVVGTMIAIAWLLHKFHWFL